METQTEKKDAGSLIETIAGILKKHCKEEYDVESLINSITASNEYIQELQAPRSEIIYDIRKIEDLIRKNGDDKLITLFREVFDVFLQGMILSGHLRHGNELIYQMSDDLHSLS